MNWFLYFALVVTLVAADDLSGGSEGTNLEIMNGYTVQGQVDGRGRPGGAAFAHLGGKLSQIPGQGPPHHDYYADQMTYLAPASTGLWPTQVTSVTYFAAGVAAALSIWYVCALALPHSKKSVEELDDDDKSSDDSAPATKDAAEKAKSRRRRAVRQDEEMTRLASIVLAAVQSGECLQRSICLLGSQITDKKKGKMADSLMTTLLPLSIRQSDYYLILRKSLRGEVSCEKYGCSAICSDCD